MVATMQDRISAARRRSFVGRSDELALFRSLLQQPDPQVALLSLNGPAGVGKSTLLRQFAAECERLGVPHVLLDARDISPTAESVRAALRLPDPASSDPTKTRPSSSDPTSTDPTSTGPTRSSAGIGAVALIDTYELLAECDSQLRTDVLPSLPADSLIVIASQYAPSTSWLTDPGWSDLLVSRRLKNLTDDECGAYLSARGLDAAHHAAAIEFTHGHPLALALVSEVLRQRGRFAPERSADVIAVLLQTLLRSTPTPLHRRALEAAAEVRVVTQPLLSALLADADVSAVFDWMLLQPFVDVGPSGLHLHDLARRVLSTDLRWRDPERFKHVHDRARTHYLARLEQADPVTQGAVLLDLMFLHSELRRFLRPADNPDSTIRMRPPRPEDSSAVRDMVTRHEGEASGALAEHWWTRQPGAWQIVRDAAGMAVGALCLLNLTDVTDSDRRTDPAVANARIELAGHAPLRPGERATLVRFWLARESYQSVSHVQSLIAVALARHYLTTNGLAVSLLPFAHPDEWTDFCAYADQHRMPAADFTVGERTYAVFGHDWRIVTPAAWVALLSRRETGDPATDPAADPADAPARQTSPDLLVLAEADFTSAVRAALRGLTRPASLRANPLLRSRMLAARVASDAATSDRVAALQALVREAAASLRSSPADEKLYRVLHRAYLAPAPTLERAAQASGIPSSTFRRQLSTAVKRVTETLWHLELES